MPVAYTEEHNNSHGGKAMSRKKSSIEDKERHRNTKACKGKLETRHGKKQSAERRKGAFELPKR
jgi:hypothetical protein